MYIKDLTEILDKDVWYLKCKECGSFNCEFVENCENCGEKIIKDIPDDN